MYEMIHIEEVFDIACTLQKKADSCDELLSSWPRDPVDAARLHGKESAYKDAATMLFQLLAANQLET